MKGAPGAGVGGDGGLDELRALIIRKSLETPPHDQAAVVPDEVLTGLERLTREETEALTDEELLASVRSLESARRMLDLAASALVGELHARGSTDKEEGLRTAPWLGWHLNLPRGECSARVRVGSFVRHHEVLREALRRGRVSFDHVALLARLATPRVAEVVHAVQAELVELAQGVRFETWAREVRALLDLADADGAHDPRPEDNRLSLTEGLDGTVHVQADLVAEWALEARAALEAEADRLFHAFRSDARATGGELAVPPRQVLLAMAFVELCRAGRAAGRAERPGATPVADVTLVVSTPPDLHDRWRRPDPHGAHADWLAGLLATTLDGMPVRPSVARLLACDPTFRVLVESHTGETLHLGRGRRHASPAQRRAVARRFGGCCFPGCDAPPSWTDLHHVELWEHGGATDLDLLAPLCRHHHGVVHRSGWSVRPAAGHGFDIVTPSGRVLPCQVRGRRNDPARE
ncbi:MAG: DUF222 domain-containing protein [Microthrixaceae bacterium]